MTQTDAILLLHDSVYPQPAVVRESVRAFSEHSRFPVLSVNAALGYPKGLDRVRFAAIVLHYTMFYGKFSPISEPFRSFLSRSDALKVAFFQDEQVLLGERIDFCAEHSVDQIYTCIAPSHAERVYGRSGASRVISYLPGYVGSELRRLASRDWPIDEMRPIDVGYRGRKPPPGWRGAALEKYEIAAEFSRRASELGLILDIETDEEKRIYGRRWPRFIASCRAMLGTESGAFIADPDGGEIPYRTISPRHFEAAALRTCQILYEGDYSGVLEPDRHYIPLRKDFANFDRVIASFGDPQLRRQLTETADRDLIASGRYAYASFIETFDRELEAAGLAPAEDRAEARRIAASALPSKLRRRALGSRRFLKSGVRVVINRIRRRPATDSLARRRARGDRD